MKNRVLVLLGGMTLLLSTMPAAHAGKWGMAGCGVGSLIFEDQPGKIQILASTTNTYFYQTSSISSGTSNCDDRTSEQASLFIAVNSESLKKDISRGNGETVAGLAHIYGCSDAGALGSALQKNFGEIYTGEQMKADEVRSNIESTVRENHDLAQSCKVLSV